MLPLCHAAPDVIDVIVIFLNVFNGPFPASFFFIFVFFIVQLVDKILPMSEFEPQISGVGSNLSAN